jgi:hypothetical protein
LFEKKKRGEGVVRDIFKEGTKICWALKVLKMYSISVAGAFKGG